MKLLTRVLLKRLSRAARPYLRATGLGQVSGVYNRSALVWQPGAQKVLVLAPHMDDETIGCGGALALHAQAGADVTVMFLTDGRHGSSDISVLYGREREQRQQALIELRKREARAALDELGVGQMICLDAEDGALAGADAVVAQLRDHLLRMRPELVYLPSFLEEHADHRAVSALLLAATQGTDIRCQCIGYEVWTPLFPNCLVRIDDVLDIKRRALQRYRSQLEQCDYLHACLGLNAYRSAGFIQGHGRYAEAFQVLDLPDYCRQFRQFRGD